MLDNISASLTNIVNQTWANLPTLGVIIALPWVAFILNLLTGNRLLALGIVPRHFYGLRGIIFAPLLHANFNHLFFNTIPLLVLSNFILLQGITYFISVTVLIAVISGLLIWCFAKSGLHVGASALITGYWALLISDIVRQGTLTAIILGGLSLYYFAGIFLGIFPSKKGISWEGHLFGLVAGLVTSYLLA